MLRADKQANDGSDVSRSEAYAEVSPHMLNSMFLKAMGPVIQHHVAVCPMDAQPSCDLIASAWPIGICSPVAMEAIRHARFDQL
nr:hypothetical protein [Pseudoroseomonas aerophila]